MNSGINHIEFWVSDLKRSSLFYGALFEKLGWHKLGESAFSTGSTELYLKERKDLRNADSTGPRHICFQATSKEMVNEVGEILKEQSAVIIRGAVEVPEYSEDYYTIDFKDPDGYVIEVAHTPNMKL